ncbi:MAG: DUF4810 domain-containing protein [Glaciimonas sp.]|nr:DUF4810 domain-containing protein [Glaciimonas sp.]
MKTHITKKSLLPFVLLSSILLTACQTPQKTIYQWESYQPQVYEYFKGERGPQEQIAALEQGLEKIKATDGLVPPGYHAQLGMLYASAGKGEQAEKEFSTEKALFPESSTYMDFLLKKSKKSKK